jgi:hypothetical protein
MATDYPPPITVRVDRETALRWIQDGLACHMALTQQEVNAIRDPVRPTARAVDIPDSKRRDFYAAGKQCILPRGDRLYVTSSTMQIHARSAQYTLPLPSEIKIALSTCMHFSLGPGTESAATTICPLVGLHPKEQTRYVNTWLRHVGLGPWVVQRSFAFVREPSLADFMHQMIHIAPVPDLIVDVATKLFGKNKSLLDKVSFQIDPPKDGSSSSSSKAQLLTMALLKVPAIRKVPKAIAASKKVAWGKLPELSRDSTLFIDFDDTLIVSIGVLIQLNGGLKEKFRVPEFSIEKGNPCRMWHPGSERVWTRPPGTTYIITGSEKETVEDMMAWHSQELMASGRVTAEFKSEVTGGVRLDKSTHILRYVKAAKAANRDELPQKWKSILFVDDVEQNIDDVWEKRFELEALGVEELKCWRFLAVWTNAPRDWTKALVRELYPLHLQCQARLFKSLDLPPLVSCTHAAVPKPDGWEKGDYEPNVNDILEDLKRTRASLVHKPESKPKKIFKQKTSRAFVPLLLIAVHRAGSRLNLQLTDFDMEFLREFTIDVGLFWETGVKLRVDPGTSNDAKNHSIALAPWTDAIIAGSPGSFSTRDALLKLYETMKEEGKGRGWYKQDEKRRSYIDEGSQDVFHTSAVHNLFNIPDVATSLENFLAGFSRYMRP